MDNSKHREKNVSYRAPFSWTALREFLKRIPFPLLERVEGNAIVRLLNIEDRLVKITLKGLWGELTVKGFTYNSPTSTTPPMTPFRSLLSDKEVAGVLTYVRNTFGNDAKPVQPSTVTRVSKQVETRGSFFMVDQILKAHPFTKGELKANKNAN
mgnify:CR=1 FL=1